MDKKLEYHKEYSEAAYKDRVYRWFNDNTSTLDDADLQKFVDLCMRGNLTFQCADEIGIDDPDISMIDHLLMDIASEKNDELINTYTDEIDWDNDYVEKYNSDSVMDKKKLEARITRLERLVYEGSPLNPWDKGVLAMGKDDEFLYTVWHYDIDQLKSLEAKTVKDLDMCKSSLRGRRTVLHPLWMHDKLDLEWRLECIRGIIEDKKVDPDYIPEQYQ